MDSLKSEPAKHARHAAGQTRLLPRHARPTDTKGSTRLVKDGAQAHADAGRLLGAPVHAVWPRRVDLVWQKGRGAGASVPVA